MLYVGIYETKTYTAFFYEKKIVITTAKQSFRIACLDSHSHTVLNELKLMILDGQVKTISDMPRMEEVLLWESCKRPSM